MTDSRALIGKRGEDKVCEYLINSGHTILERNWRIGHLEVDIISLSPKGIHFIEVKTRVAPVNAAPAENVRGNKQRNITKAALKFMAVHGPTLGYPEISLDIAGVVLEKGKTSINYIEGAYIPMYL